MIPATTLMARHEPPFSLARNAGEGPGGEGRRYQMPLDRFHNVRWHIRYRLPGAFVLVAFKAG